MPSDREIIARRLKIARQQAGLSQGQVAAKLKMRRPSISEIESGKRKLSAQELKALAELYRVDLAWLTGSESDAAYDERVQLAARHLARLRDDDLNSVLNLLRTLRNQNE